MFPRVGGAILALAAAALLAVATLVPAWWSGHPDVDGHAMRLKSLEVGPLGATSCNTGGDGKCTNTSLTATFQTVGRVEAGVNSALALMLIVLAISTLRRAEGRRLVGKAIIAAVVAAGIGGVLLIVFGPGIKADGHTLSVPFGFGLALFWAGVATAIAAALVTAREIPRALYIAQRVTPLPGFDMQALIADDKATRPEPPRAAQSPGGALPGFAGPLGSPQPPAQPLFASAPQLRPLYEMGDGAPAAIRPPLPERAPTPIARETLDRMADGPAGILAPARPAIPLPTLPRPKPPSLAPPRPVVPAPFEVLAPRTEMPKPLPRRPTTMPPPVAPAAPVERKSIPPKQSFVLPMTERAETDPSDNLETRQREREELSNADAKLERAETSTRDDLVPLSAVGDSTSPSVSLDLPTSDEPTLDAGGADATGVNPVVPQHDEPPADPTSETEPAPELPKPPPPAAKTPAPMLKTPAPKLVGPPSRKSDRAILPTPTAPSPAAPPPSSDPGDAPKIPMSTASTSLPPPTKKQTQSSGPSPACPQCEAPMAWVEEHLRFYCKSCRMYF